MTQLLPTDEKPMINEVDLGSQSDKYVICSISLVNQIANVMQGTGRWRRQLAEFTERNEFQILLLCFFLLLQYVDPSGFRRLFLDLYMIMTKKRCSHKLSSNLNSFDGVYNIC